MDIARGKKRPAESPIVVEEKLLSVEDLSFSEERIQLRARWELASVFNFLNVCNSFHSISFALPTPY